MPRKTNLKSKSPMGVLVIGKLTDMGKTQKWLADEIKASPIYLWKVLSGKEEPSLTFIKKIAVVIGVEAYALVMALLYDFRGKTE